ncbi:type I-U CRISPR-associated protein Csb2 [Gordonia sp. (in: high G+C Gram-positive bacteria)]|uniref:type I-G CRISPR-associated protein Csb2 n=1 Tax=Gordonia sp. (in: high G+C Gram-positive bacteria) TaxID=84139 RepID=UPI0035296643
MVHIRVDYLARPQFHGLDGHGRQEWPPSPLRLLGALISGACGLTDPAERAESMAALERLSMAGAPVIHAPERVRLDHPDTYTEKSAPAGAKATTGSLEDFLDLAHTGMSTSSRTAKPVRGVLLAEPTIIFDLESIGDDDVRPLRNAAAGVGYFGRSQDHAVISVCEGSPGPGAVKHVFDPRPHPGGSQRGWTSSSVAWFEARHQAIMTNPGSPLPSDAGAFTRITYDLRDPRKRNDRGKPAHGEVSAVMLNRGVRPGDIPRLMRKIGAVSDTTVIPLVNFNQPKSQCYGFAVSGPLATRLDTVSRIRDRLGSLASDETGADSALFHRYAAMTTGEHWITATPIRAFGHPLMLQRALSEAFAGDVRIMELSTAPLDRWQQRLPNLDLTDGLSQWFVRFTTTEKNPAPTMVGACTELGFGLCVPIPPSRGDR